MRNLWPMESLFHSPCNFESLQSCPSPPPPRKKKHAQRRFQEATNSCICSFLKRDETNRLIFIKSLWQKKLRSEYILSKLFWSAMLRYRVVLRTPLFSLCDVCCHTTLPPIFNMDALRDSVGVKKTVKPW